MTESTSATERERFNWGLIGDVFDVLEQHGYVKGNHGDVGRAVGILGDLVEAFEGEATVEEATVEEDAVEEDAAEEDAETAVAPAPRAYLTGDTDLAAGDALRAAGYAVYLPTGRPHADVDALCHSSLVVHTRPESARTATDTTVSLAAYGLRIPEVFAGDLVAAFEGRS